MGSEAEVVVSAMGTVAIPNVSKMVLKRWRKLDRNTGPMLPNRRFRHATR